MPKVTHTVYDQARNCTQISNSSLIHKSLTVTRAYSTLPLLLTLYISQAPRVDAVLLAVFLLAVHQLPSVEAVLLAEAICHQSFVQSKGVASRATLATSVLFLYPLTTQANFLLKPEIKQAGVSLLFYGPDSAKHSTNA